MDDEKLSADGSIELVIELLGAVSLVGAERAGKQTQRLHNALDFWIVVSQRRAVTDIVTHYPGLALQYLWPLTSKPKCHSFATFLGPIL